MTNNYLFNELLQKRSLKIMLISNNAYWTCLKRMEGYFENCHVETFGDSISYIDLASEQRKEQINDCDLIIFYSSQFYTEEEFLELKKLAMEISYDKNKRVSIGYSYIIPNKQRIRQYITDQIKIASVNNGVESIKEISELTPYFTPYELASLTLIEHDELENQKKLRKINNINKCCQG